MVCEVGGLGAGDANGGRARVRRLREALALGARVV